MEAKDVMTATPLHVRTSQLQNDFMKKRMKELGIKYKRQYFLYLLEQDGYEITAQDFCGAR